MPRIRTFKPEFFADEKLGPMCVTTRFTFAGLISMADDAGRVIDNLKQIDAYIFPFTEDTAREALIELHAAARIRRGEAANAQRVIQIVNWHHQKIDKPNYSACLPSIAGDSDDAAMRFRKAKRTADNGDGVPSPAPLALVVDTSPNVPRQVDDTSAPHISSSTSIVYQEHGAVAASSSSEHARVDRSKLRGWRLAAAANAGFFERDGKLQQQIMPQPKVADELHDAKVDTSFALRAIYEAALTLPVSQSVSTLAYFTKHVIERWQTVSRLGIAPAAVPFSPTDRKLTRWEAEVLDEARGGDDVFQDYADSMGMLWKTEYEAVS